MFTSNFQNISTKSLAKISNNYQYNNPSFNKSQVYFKNSPQHFQTLYAFTQKAIKTESQISLFILRLLSLQKKNQIEYLVLFLLHCKKHFSKASLAHTNASLFDFVFSFLRHFFLFDSSFFPLIFFHIKIAIKVLIKDCVNSSCS